MKIIPYKSKEYDVQVNYIILLPVDTCLLTRTKLITQLNSPRRNEFSVISVMQVNPHKINHTISPHKTCDTYQSIEVLCCILLRNQATSVHAPFSFQVP
jgi:hypothetical protein